MSGKPLVLLIEDNPVDTLLITEIFTEINKGFNLECAESLSDGMNLLSRKDYSFDAVLLDLYLPDSHGLETFTKIHSFAPDLAIVILTSMNDEIISLRAVQEGAQDYLIKGQVSGQLLIRSIRYAIERKQIEAALSESQKRYKSLFDDSPTPMWEEDFSEVKIEIDKLKESGITDFAAYFENNPGMVKSLIKKVKVLDINKAVLKLHNAYNKEDIFNDVTIVFTDQTYIAIRYELAMIAQGVRTFDFNQVVKTFDNQFRHNIVRWSASPNNEKSWSNVLVSIIDITEIKIAELALRESEAMLNEAQKVAHIGSWTINPKTGEFTWSEELFRIHGIDSHLHAPNINEYKEYFNGTDWGKFLEELQNLKRNGQEFEMELNIKRPNGDERVLLSKARIKRKDTEEVLIVGTSQDITERKKSEKELAIYRENLEELIKVRTSELEKAKEEAENATKAKSEFLANMSHEIRTPMNSIVGFADLLALSVRDEKQRSQVDSIRNSAKNLLTIINDILDLSKIEAGKLNVEFEPVNIQYLIKDIEEIFIQKIKDKGLQFSTYIDEQIPNTIFIDEIRLRQILFNLIGNAIKFTDKGFVKLSVKVLYKSSSDAYLDLEITVQDSGIGIRKEQQQLIFEAFNQQVGQNTKKYGGTGLGLTITKRLVEMMGGKINVISSSGNGSTFELIIPGLEFTNEKLLIKPEKSFNPDTIIFLNATVLICDDNISDRQLIIDFLEKYPVRLLVADNGVSALEIANQQHPDLIIMDFLMPEMNGIEAANIIRNSSGTRTIPIIVVSASGKVNSLKEENKHLFDDFLLKPIHLVDLVESLKKFLKYELVTQDHTFDEFNLKEFYLGNEHQAIVAELIDVMEKEISPVYNASVNSQKIDQIETFGDKIITTGEKYNLPFLVHYGQKIKILATNFDIEQLLVLLKIYPGLVDQLIKIRGESTWN